MNLEVQIRLARRGDYNQIEQLMQQVNELHVNWRSDIYHSVNPVLPVEMFLDSMERNEVLVAEHDGKVVGLLIYVTRNITGGPMVSRKVMFIDSMAIDEAYRGMGIGHQFFAHAKQICKDENYDGLELQVNAKNHAAKEMYEKCGFTEKSINMELL